jgi:ketosteroid isomerase-like protein
MKTTVATRIKTMVLALALAAGAGAARAQLAFPDATAKPAAPNPLTDTTTTPGKTQLFDLEARFAKDVREKGGAGFAAWFADDGITLGNGAAPVIGKVAIAKSANWLPTAYELTWTPTDGLMGPSGDMGYTWGHFEGHSKNAAGQTSATIVGRYLTIWRRQPDGTWKVVLDAGANEPVEAPGCCTVPAVH